MDEKESRYSHSKGKVLIGNWVEQKFDDYIDGDDPHWLKRGHKCILSSSPVAVKDYISTTHATYVPCIHPVTPKPRKSSHRDQQNSKLANYSLKANLDVEENQ